MLEIKRKILACWWNLRYKDCDVLWFDNLVDMETGERGINVYHTVGSVKESCLPMNMLGIKTMTRMEAESIGGRPCEDCFNNVLPRSIKC